MTRRFLAATLMTIGLSAIGPLLAGAAEDVPVVGAVADEWALNAQEKGSKWWGNAKKLLKSGGWNIVGEVVWEGIKAGAVAFWDWLNEPDAAVCYST